HPDVEQNRVGTPLCHCLAGGRGMRGGVHLVTLVYEDILDQLSAVGLVVDNQHIGFGLLGLWTLAGRHSLARATWACPRAGGSDDEVLYTLRPCPPSATRFSMPAAALSAASCRPTLRVPPARCCASAGCIRWRSRHCGMVLEDRG